MIVKSAWYAVRVRSRSEHRTAAFLAAKDLECFLPSWQRFPARVAVQSVNEPGSLAQIAQVIADHDGNIDNIRMSRKSPDFTSVTIDLEVYDLKHLSAIIAQLRAKPVVARAERVNG